MPSFYRLHYKLLAHGLSPWHDCVPTMDQSVVINGPHIACHRSFSLSGQNGVGQVHRVLRQITTNCRGNARQEKPHCKPICFNLDNVQINFTFPFAPPSVYVWTFGGDFRFENICFQDFWIRYWLNFISLPHCPHLSNFFLVRLYWKIFLLYVHTALE